MWSPFEVHLTNRTRQITDARFIDRFQQWLRLAVPTGVGAHFDALQMHGKILEGKVPHLYCEPRAFRLRRLLKNDAASERGFESATGSALEVILNERLE